MKIKLVIFDVNQTMFSLSEIERLFRINKLKKELVEVWFSSVLKEGFAYSLSGQYIDFFNIGINELKKIFLQNKKPFTEKLIDNIMKGFENLDVHSDIKQSLKLLKKKKIKVVTLTNGSDENTRKLLKSNGIDKYVERCFSINKIRLWKPHKEVYLTTCKRMKIKKENTLMVAVHGWDVNGAKLAGLKTAFISRYEKMLSEFYMPPDLNAENCYEIVKKL